LGRERSKQRAEWWVGELSYKLGIVDSRGMIDVNGEVARAFIRAYMGRKREVWPTPDTSGTSEARRYQKPPEPGRHFVSPRARAAGHRVADFNTLDDLVAHARGEGATHLVSLLIRGTGKGATKLYFPRSDGAYDEANVRSEGGYWHTEGPSSRKKVTQLPSSAVPIEEYGGGRGGRRSFGYADAPRRNYRPATDMSARAETAGIEYATRQLESDHFMDWVRTQLIEASKMPPEDVLPLETKRDAMVIARNMLQDLENDTKRNLDEDAAFWEGFRKTLDGSRGWLADELLRIKGEMGGGDVEEDRRRGPRTGRLTRSTARPGTPVRVAGSDSMYRGMTGTVVEPDARRLAALDDHNKRFLKGEGTVLVETQRGELFVVHARALERLGTAVTRAMDRDSKREKRPPKAKRSAPRRKR
jgi:hypothetical protein